MGIVSSIAIYRSPNMSPRAAVGPGITDLERHILLSKYLSLKRFISCILKRGAACSYTSDYTASQTRIQQSYYRPY